MNKWKDKRLRVALICGLAGVGWAFLKGDAQLGVALAVVVLVGLVGYTMHAK